MTHPVTQVAVSLPHIMAQCIASIFWTTYVVFADGSSTFALSIALVNAIAALLTATAALIKVYKKKGKS